MISLRGSSPKMASDNSTESASLPSSVVTFIFFSRSFLLGISRFGRSSTITHQPELAGLRRILRQFLLDSVTDRNPAALRARHRAFDQDEAALDVGLHHAQIERGDAVDTHMAGHLLVLEGL